MLKKLILFFGALIALLLIAIVAIPFFVNVDDYRPKIVALANEHINGKFELGKLTLSLWGEVRVNVDGFTLSDSHGRKVVSVKDVYFQIPFASVLTGSPTLTFKMQNPEVFVVKDKTGKMNVMTLVKSSGPAAAPAEPTGKATTGKSTEVPGIVSRARLGIEMKNALLSYKDEATDLKSEVKDLNVVARDISLSKAMELKVWADLDTKMGKTLNVKGPANLYVRMNPKMSGEKFESAELHLKADLDGVAISMPGTFEKSKSIPANADAEMRITPDSVDISKMDIHFHNAEVNVKGNITELEAANGPQMDLFIKSNEIQLKPWAELLPALKAENLSGSASFNAEAKKDTANLSLKLNAPGNDLAVAGKIVSFAKPRVDISVTSKGMDLDKIVDFKAAPQKTAAAAPATEKSTAGKAAPAQEEDFDALLDPVRKNKLVADTVATVKVNMAFVKAYGVKMSDIQSLMTFKGLAFAVDSFKMGLFNGGIKASALFQMAPKTPTYHFNMEATKLDLQQAVSSQMEAFKNTIIGIATFKMDGNGASLNPTPAKKNLVAKGNLKVENAKFATIDIAKVVSEGISKAVNGIPVLKGQKINVPGNLDSKYQIVTCDFTISGGRFVAPNFMAKAEPNKGLDVKGNTQLGLLDFGLNADWEVIDTYNVTKAKDLSVDQQGIRVEHILADKDGAVHLPIKITGTALQPQYNYGAMGEALAKVALDNTGKALQGKAKAEVQKKLQEQIKGNPQVQDALKKFGGKLFGN